MTTSRVNGDDEPSEHVPHPPVTPEVRTALHILTDEVHACTQSVGRLTAEVANIRADFRSFENRVARMRGRLDSVSDEARTGAEDTARHEVEKLRREMAAMDLEKAEKDRATLERQLEAQNAAEADRKKEAKNRNLLIALAIAGPIITHIVEMFGRH